MSCSSRGNCSASHLFEFGITLVEQYVFAIVNAGKGGHILTTECVEVFEVFVFFGQAHIATLVGNDVRVGNEGGHFVVASLEAFEFF